MGTRNSNPWGSNAAAPAPAEEQEEIIEPVLRNQYLTKLQRLLPTFFEDVKAGDEAEGSSSLADSDWDEAAVTDEGGGAVAAANGDNGILDLSEDKTQLDAIDSSDSSAS